MTAVPASSIAYSHSNFDIEKPIHSLTMCGTENGTAGAASHPAQNHNPASSPYSQVQDYISQVNNYKCVYISIAAVAVLFTRFQTLTDCIQDH